MIQPSSLSQLTNFNRGGLISETSERLTLDHAHCLPRVTSIHFSGTWNICAPYFCGCPVCQAVLLEVVSRNCKREAPSVEEIIFKEREKENPMAC